MFDLSDKTAVVTGSTRGIGRAIAEAFLKAGASVIVSSESEEDTLKAERDMRALGFEKIIATKCDVTSSTDRERLLSLGLSRFGGIDILVANAGIPDEFKGSVQFSHSVFDRVIDVNLRSVVQLCSEVVPLLKARRGGSIILMSSLAAVRGNKALGPYALSKAAIAQLARNLAVELGPFDIRANAIAPGFIETELAAPLIADQQFMARRMQLTPLRRPGQPSEVAALAVYLASAGGGFMTGQTLVLDGGTSITDGS